MIYNYYLKQRFPMCENKLNQILAKNPRLIHRSTRYSKDPFNRKYTNQEITLANEGN